MWRDGADRVEVWKDGHGGWVHLPRSPASQGPGVTSSRKARLQHGAPRVPASRAHGTFTCSLASAQQGCLMKAHLRAGAVPWGCPQPRSGPAVRRVCGSDAGLRARPEAGGGKRVSSASLSRLLPSRSSPGGDRGHRGARLPGVPAAHAAGRAALLQQAGPVSTVRLPSRRGVLPAAASARPRARPVGLSLPAAALRHRNAPRALGAPP